MRLKTGLAPRGMVSGSFAVTFGAAICSLLIAVGIMMAAQAPRPLPPPRAAAQIVRSQDGFERFLIHVSTDKPIYRGGEKLYVRGVLLNTDAHKPASNGLGRGVSFEIKGPKGDSLASGFAAITDSVAGFSWDIPAGQAGGEYTIYVTHPSAVKPAERKFDVRAYRAPRLKSQIVFVRDGYGPGDTVAVNLHVERAEGGIPAGAKVSVTARVDGEETWTGSATVDASGNAGATFKLPAAIARGEGVVAMVIADGGTVETASKTIPILLQTIDVAIYPEGGDLVAGLPNRVYIEGRTPSRKPADMTGVVVDRAGREVAAFRTEHDGRGRVSFVPANGQSYSLRVTEPAGIKTLFPLPAVKPSGVVLSSTADITSRGTDPSVRLSATSAGAYTIVLSRGGKEIASKAIALRAARPADVTLPIPAALDGVLVATAYDDRGTPVAERLLFRQPAKQLHIKIVPDRADYVPGDKVTLRITSTDETGKPAGAVVGLTVTDSSVLEMIEKREQAPRLPVMVLLEQEVKDLSDAHVYLDETNSKAPLATDLLLGTQGWRRFATAGSGLLSGIIMDPTAARLPGVTVRATNRDTGEDFTTVTGERGDYLFQSLKAGTYQVNAVLPGFQTGTADRLQVVHNGRVSRDFRLNVAMMAQAVEVRAAVGGVLGGILPMAAAPAAAAVQNVPIADMKLLALDENEALAAAPPLKEEAAAAEFDRIAPLGNALRDRAERKQFAPNLVTVREYAHTLRPGWTAASRSDFAETVYWNAGVKTDPLTGTASVSFNLSDSVTSFRVLADAFAANGTLGFGLSEVESVKPFSLEPKIPLQVTSGDVIQLPVAIINGTSRDLRGVELTLKSTAGIRFSAANNNSIAMGGKERLRRLMRIDVGDFTGTATLTLDGKAGSYGDTVVRTLDVRPLGFPQERALGGMLERNATKSFEFTIPADVVRGSLSSSVTVYPTPLASMTDALQGLLQQPFGCFEQTSSTSYPMVMAQQYFLSHSGVDPAVVQKARDLLDASYKRLTGFESPSKGYEWFGADPGHEALTAYGLMQFTDMSRVRSVDPAMVERTRAWLLSRRDGKGGFKLDAKALDSFGGAPVDTTNAYIVWALTESGEKGLEKEIAAVKATAASTQDSYIAALAANILHAAGDHAAARQLMDKLARHQDAAGNVSGAVTSITRSGGNALAIETTALSVLAWLREPSYAAQVQKSLKWIVESNKSGRYGSTQSTILALRAIIAYDAANARPKAPGRLYLTLDGKALGNPVAFDATTQGALQLPPFADELKPGKHTLELRMEDGSGMPFSMAVRYHTTLPESAEQAQVAVQVRLRNSEVQEGAVTEATVSIANKSDKPLPTPVAIIGIPGGLEVRHDQLKELVKAGKIAAYEVIGREVVLYWRYLKAQDKFDLPLSLVAAIPGTFTGPASRAYLYYTDEYKAWTPGVKVTITQR